MSGEQVEYAIIAAGGLFGTLIGLGRIDVGLPALLLAHSFWQ